MRKGDRISLALLVILLGALQIGADRGQVAAEQEAPAISLVIQAGPLASVRRSGWTNFSGLSLGAAVQFGDLLDPKGKPLFVLCANLTVQPVTRLGPVPCPRERPILYQDNVALVGWQRGKLEDTTIPFLISPRATAIETPYPLIWWNAVSDVDGYRVTVRGGETPWSTLVNDPKTNWIIYPKDAPALKPGIAYTVEITTVSFGADGRSSTEEDAPGLSFTLLTAEDINAIVTDVAGIRTSVKDKTVSELAVAYYDAERGLKAEALQSLLGISGDLLPLPGPPAPQSRSSFSTSPVLYLRVGDLFAASQISLYAAAAYSRARDLAVKNGDLESQATAMTELARLATDPTQRAEEANDALKLWQKLGAQQQIETIKKDFDLADN